MALEIFKLVGSVFVDTEKANESLQKTDKKASGFASTLGSVVGKAAGMATAVVGAATAVGGAALGVADKVSKQTDEIDKASIRMGISAESYQELAYAAGQCGVEMSVMEGAAKKLEGTDLSFDDAINQIMELGTAEERSAKAAELFGEKIAYNLSPLIEQSGDEFDGLIQRANDLGLVMSGDAVKAGVEFGDLLSDIKSMVGSLANQFGTALFPIVNELFKQIIDFMPQIQSYMGQIVPILVDLISEILPILFEIIQALLPVAIQIIEEILPLAVDIIHQLLPLIQALVPLITPISGLLMAIITPCVQFLSAILPALIATLTLLVESVVPALGVVVNLTAGSIKDYLTTFFNFFEPFIGQIISLFEGVSTFLTGVFTGDWEMVWQGITSIMKTYINGMIVFLEAFINLFVDSINAIINSAKRLASLLPNVDLDTSVGTIPRVSIPKLAKGGVIEEEGSAIVGERGAELLTLPKGASVTPLNNSGFDYDKLASAITNGIKDALQITIPVNIGNELLETVVVDAINTATYRSGGR
jgi:phage-related protein